MKREEQLVNKLTDKSYKILIHTNGTMLSSEQFASRIDELGTSGRSDVAVIIGAGVHSI
ncbi:23S rRNA (pseudouridine(1915)-N(3))-methyltransferase RlmH [Paenibacillus mendelii]|uniref:23S rRNA (Pseudouridine(1915)-N(3))-methyltransferase RlmH n=1 Tax=Paenibacillus mendelii TaxID=206163 RepID=A0ABV6JEN7_9BACL